VKTGTFRDDLYYRLNVIPITLPPLRKRQEDILPLIRHFLTKYCGEMGRPVMTVAKEALEALEAYSWPGNVRELENVVERTVALADGNMITVGDLPANIGKAFSRGEEEPPKLTGQGIDLARVMADMEKKMIVDALTLGNGVKARAAALLNLNRTTLVEKMRRLGMEK
jgi:DNA-binding NtrC family response regulator